VSLTSPDGDGAGPDGAGPDGGGPDGAGPDGARPDDPRPDERDRSDARLGSRPPQRAALHGHVVDRHVTHAVARHTMAFTRSYSTGSSSGGIKTTLSCRLVRCPAGNRTGVPYPATEQV
jgi:hypothetical protein